MLVESKYCICDNYVLKKKQEKKSNEQITGCYITTVICSVLGYSNECYVLKQMRDFRNNIMQKDSQYLNILLEYDVIGPMIAENIQKEYIETENKDMWTRFYQLYLSKTADLISFRKYKEAVEMYKCMMIALKDYFGISEIDFTIYREKYDMSHGGHGKLILKQLATNM